MTPLFATVLDISPLTLVRVDDPDYPGAETRSATGAVLLEPPPEGIPWRYETVAEPDAWPATEAIEALNAADWHDGGYLGQGVRIAVFDVAWFGSEFSPDELGEVTTHDCFRDPSCRLPMDTDGRYTFERGVHGYACAEVIRDLAPEAELHLVRVNGLTGFENAVDWAIREDIDLISMSMSFYNDSFYDGSGGPFAPLLFALEDHDVLLVASAGNAADQHWRGIYKDSNANRLADFTGDDALYVYLPGPKDPTIYLNWNQHNACGTTDLDLWLLDDEGDLLGRSQDEQSSDADHCEPIERMTAAVDEAGWYRAVVALRSGSVPELTIDLHTRSGSFFEPVPEGSIADPGAHPLTLTVGAAGASHYLTGKVESFSSWGLPGTRKPDIVGPDGLTTDAYGAVGFFGTSASTPAVTGALAVLMSSEPDLTPRQASERLQASAFGEDLVFHDPSHSDGPGRARLPNRFDSVLGCGRRPLLACLLVLPIWPARRRTRGVYRPTAREER